MFIIESGCIQQEICCHFFFKEFGTSFLGWGTACLCFLSLEQLKRLFDLYGICNSTQKVAYLLVRKSQTLVALVEYQDALGQYTQSRKEVVLSLYILLEVNLLEIIITFLVSRSESSTNFIRYWFRVVACIPINAT